MPHTCIERNDEVHWEISQHLIIPAQLTGRCDLAPDKVEAAEGKRKSAQIVK
jgi:hypothetical protein